MVEGGGGGGKMYDSHPGKGEIAEIGWISYVI